MKQQLEEIEKKLMDLYAEIKKEIPGIHCLDLAISETDKISEPYLYGFIHIGDDCKSFNNTAKVYDLWHKHQILFQKFNHVLS